MCVCRAGRESPRPGFQPVSTSLSPCVYSEGRALCCDVLVSEIVSQRERRDLTWSVRSRSVIADSSPGHTRANEALWFERQSQHGDSHRGETSLSWNNVCNQYQNVMFSCLFLFSCPGWVSVMRGGVSSSSPLEVYLL